MEPRIQYVKTSDGVNIAFWTLGEGTPLLEMQNPGACHIHFAYHNWPDMRAWYERLAQRRMVVAYDPRGTGMSDRLVSDYSLDGHVRDVEAVVDYIGLKPCAVWSWSSAGPVAIAYAARHPEAVSHLILWCTAATRVYGQQFQALRALMNVDWETWVDAVAHMAIGSSPRESDRQFAAYLREAIPKEDFRRLFSAIQRFDAEPMLPAISSHTLVMHRQHIKWLQIEASRKLAQGIRNARLVVLDGESSFPMVGDSESVFRAIDAFLGDTNEAAPVFLPSGTAIILFADIADSTALTERLGDAAFRGKARELGASLRAVVRECGGTPVEGPTLGDGVLAVFTSAREAIEAARRCGKAGDDSGFPLHLGLHAGDVTREKDPDGRANVYGGAVNIASRISGLSAPGEVLVSETVRSLARTSADVTFEDRGEQALKGVGEPVRVWVVREGTS